MLFDIENILAETPPFLITIDINREATVIDVVPHWFSKDSFCNFYIFQAGKELGTVNCTGINEWEWLSEPNLKWLAQRIGNEIDWHYL